MKISKIMLEKYALFAKAECDYGHRHESNDEFYYRKEFYRLSDLHFKQNPNLYPQIPLSVQLSNLDEVSKNHTHTPD